MEARPSAPKDPSRIEGFEGMRALAAILIFVYHLLHITYVPQSHWVVRELVGELRVGVVIFFVVSGFLLYLPFARLHAGLGPRVGVTGYLLRRGMRIYPGYWVALLATVLFFVPQFRFQDAGQALRHALLVYTYSDRVIIWEPRGLPQSWSLVVELSFYLFLPAYAAVVSWGARRRWWRAELAGLVVLTLIGIGARALVESGDPPVWTSVLPAHLPYFAIGMGLAVARVGAEREGAGAARLANLLRSPGRAWMVSAGASVVLAFLPGPVLPPRYAWSSFVAFLGQGVIAFAIVAPFTVAASAEHVVTRALRHPTMEFLGRTSYGIYLWHVPVMIYLYEHFGREVEGTLVKIGVLSVPATLLLAWASHRYVEAPAIRWSRRRRGTGAAQSPIRAEPEPDAPRPDA